MRLGLPGPDLPFNLIFFKGWVLVLHFKEDTDLPVGPAYVFNRPRCLHHLSGTYSTPGHGMDSLIARKRVNKALVAAVKQTRTP
eukprot:31868_5